MASKQVHPSTKVIRGKRLTPLSPIPYLAQQPSKPVGVRSVSYLNKTKCQQHNIEKYILITITNKCKHTSKHVSGSSCGDVIAKSTKSPRPNASTLFL